MLFSCYLGVFVSSVIRIILCVNPPIYRKRVSRFLLFLCVFAFAGDYNGVIFHSHALAIGQVRLEIFYVVVFSCKVF